MWASVSVSVWQFVTTICLDSMGGILPNLHGYIMGTDQRAGFPSNLHGCIIETSQRAGFPPNLHGCNIETSQSARIPPNLHGCILMTMPNADFFGDHDSIIKVKSQLVNITFFLKMRYFLNQWMGIHQVFMAIDLGHHDPFAKVIVLYVGYLENQMLGCLQTCMSI